MFSCEVTAMEDGGTFPNSFLISKVASCDMGVNVYSSDSNSSTNGKKEIQDSSNWCRYR